MRHLHKCYVMKVKNDGVEYAYIRLGYRGYESGKIVVDDKYEDNIAACNEVGLDCGVYFFTEAKTEAEGIEEEYQIEIPSEDLEGITTVGALLAYIEKKQA